MKRIRVERNILINAMKEHNDESSSHSMEQFNRAE